MSVKIIPRSAAPDLYQYAYEVQTQAPDGSWSKHLSTDSETVAREAADYWEECCPGIPVRIIDNRA